MLQLEYLKKKKIDILLYHSISSFFSVVSFEVCFLKQKLNKWILLSSLSVVSSASVWDEINCQALSSSIISSAQLSPPTALCTAPANTWFCAEQEVFVRAPFLTLYTGVGLFWFPPPFLVSLLLLSLLSSPAQLRCNPFSVKKLLGSNILNKGVSDTEFPTHPATQSW